MFMKLKFIFAALALGLVMVLAPVEGRASTAGGATTTTTTDDFGRVGARLCRIVKAITGKVGRAVATIAVIFLGLGAFFGKVTWGLAVATSIGIFAIFGASTIVKTFNEEGQSGDCQTSD